MFVWVETNQNAISATARAASKKIAISIQNSQVGKKPGLH